MKSTKVITLLAGAAMAVGVFAGVSAATNNTETAAEASAEAFTETITETSAESNTLVVYFSAQGHTGEIAEAIAEELNADTFEIIPVDEYTEDDLNWRDENSRVSREHADESLQDIELVSVEVEDWESYDTVFIGAPTWWQKASWVVNSFVKENDFTGKTVIPFTTSQASDFGESGVVL